MLGIKNKFSYFAILLSVLSVCSCETVFEDLPECIQNVRFVYDYTLSGGDAFAAQVESVDLYVFDNNGAFVKKYSESGAALADENYRMPVELASGKYKLVAWCGMADNAFTVPDFTDYNSITCAISGMQGNSSNADLGSMWYGALDVNHDFNEAATYTIHLVKDTNNIRVQLQHIDGSAVDASMFDFEITDSNSILSCDNTPHGDLTYYPFYQGTVQVGGNKAGEVMVACAEFSTSRLYVGNLARLKVTDKSNGRVVMDIPLLDYLVMRSEKYAKMSNQEYLDREDDYTLQLFLNEQNTWITTTIIINGWTVRINNI